MAINKNTKLLICALGIFVCYFYFALLLEKITRGQYLVCGTDHMEKFTYTFALVHFQCLINYAFAKTIIMATMSEGEDTTRTLYYVTSAMTYLIAMVCSTMALQFVSYPTQVVGKAGKPIPVMILGVLLGKKVYPVRKYFFVLFIVIGVVLFMFKDGMTSDKKTDRQVGIGEFLLLLSLTLDGLMGAIQERMRAEHKTKSLYMMLNMNFWSMIFSGIYILLSGELSEFFGFLQRHPASLWHIASFSIAGALGQYFIFLTVADFGPLPCSIITTTRKFFTVLGSVIFFGNNLIPRQWIGTFIVFSGLLLDAVYGR